MIDTISMNKCTGPTAAMSEEARRWHALPIEEAVALAQGRLRSELLSTQELGRSLERIGRVLRGEEKPRDLPARCPWDDWKPGRDLG